MKSNTIIEKMESAPFSRSTDSFVSLSFSNKINCSPHIFACYNNEVSSSLYLHNKLIVLSPLQNCNNNSELSNSKIEEIVDRFTSDMESRFRDYLSKETFYKYTSNNTQGYISYIESSDLLYSSKSFASAKRFVMYSTGEQVEDDTPSNGTLDHNALLHRDLENQHPILSITGLSAVLDNKASTSHTHNYISSITKQMVEEVLIGNITTHIHTIYALLNGSPTEDFETKTLTASGVGYFTSGLVMFGTEGGTGGGSTAGTYYHDQLENRNLSSQHTIAAITDLQAMLDSKVYSSDARLTNARLASDVYPWAKSASKPSYSWDEIVAKADVVAYHGTTHFFEQGSALWIRGGWNEHNAGASIGYYSLYSGGSASSILLKHYYYDNTIYFKKSIDTNRWLSDWQYFYTSANANRSDTDWACSSLHSRVNIHCGATKQPPHSNGRWIIVDGKSDGVRAGIELHGEGSQNQFTTLQQVGGTTYLTNDITVNGVNASAGGGMRLIPTGVYFPETTPNNNMGIGIEPMSANRLAVRGKAAIGQFTEGTAVIDAFNGYAYYGCNHSTMGARIDRYGNAAITGTVVMFTT